MVLERAFRGTPECDKLSRFNIIHQKWVTNMVQSGWDGEKHHCVSYVQIEKKPSDTSSLAQAPVPHLHIHKINFAIYGDF